MNTQELVAYIGAAAWLPQIFKWGYSYLVKPILEIIPNQTIDISYTSFGPIFNIKMTFISKRKPILIDNITLDIKHEDGDTHTFRWFKIVEFFSEVSDSMGNKQTISKEQSPIALRIPVDFLSEKFIQFQEPKFKDHDNELENSLHAHIISLRKKNCKDIIEKTINSTEKNNLVEHRENWFWWKKGKYTVTIKIQSPDKFNFKENEFSFNLSQTNIDSLKFNIYNIPTFIDSQIESAPEKSNLSWLWVYPKVERNRK